MVSKPLKASLNKISEKELKKEKDFSFSIFGLLNEYNENPNIHLQEEMNKIIKEIKDEARRDLIKETNKEYHKTPCNGCDQVFCESYHFWEWLKKKEKELNP